MRFNHSFNYNDYRPGRYGTFNDSPLGSGGGSYEDHGDEYESTMTVVCRNDDVCELSKSGAEFEVEGMIYPFKRGYLFLWYCPSCKHEHEDEGEYDYY